MYNSLFSFSPLFVVPFPRVSLALFSFSPSVLSHIYLFPPILFMFMARFLSPSPYLFSVFLSYSSSFRCPLPSRPRHPAIAFSLYRTIVLVLRPRGHLPHAVVKAEQGKGVRQVSVLRPAHCRFYDAVLLLWVAVFLLFPFQSSASLPLLNLVFFCWIC